MILYKLYKNEIYFYKVLEIHSYDGISKRTNDTMLKKNYSSRTGLNTLRPRTIKLCHFSFKWRAIKGKKELWYLSYLAHGIENLFDFESFLGAQENNGWEESTSMKWKRLSETKIRLSRILWAWQLQAS